MFCVIGTEPCPAERRTVRPKRLRLNPLRHTFEVLQHLGRMVERASSLI